MEEIVTQLLLLFLMFSVNVGLFKMKGSGSPVAFSNITRTYPRRSSPFDHQLPLRVSVDEEGVLQQNRAVRCLFVLRVPFRACAIRGWITSTQSFESSLPLEKVSWPVGKSIVIDTSGLSCTFPAFQLFPPIVAPSVLFIARE